MHVQYLWIAQLSSIVVVSIYISAANIREYVLSCHKLANTACYETFGFVNQW